MYTCHKGFGVHVFTRRVLCNFPYFTGPDVHLFQIQNHSGEGGVSADTALCGREFFFLACCEIFILWKNVSNEVFKYWGHRSDEKCIQNFGRKTVKEETGGKSRRIWLDNIRWTLGKYDSKVQTGCIWLNVETSYGLLWTRWWTFGFHEMRRVA